MPVIDEVSRDLASTASPTRDELLQQARDEGLLKDSPDAGKAPVKMPEAQDLMQPQSKDSGHMSVDMGKDVQSAATGVAKGTATLVQGMANSAMDAANSIANAAGITGNAQGDLIDQSNKLDWKALTPKPDDPTMERVFRGITQYAAPVAALMASGLGEVGALAVNAGIDYGTLDPHQERLTGMAADKFPELRNMAVIGNFANWLADNKNESDAEGRFKNALEGAGIGAAMAGAFKGTQKVSQFAQKYLNERKAAQQAMKAMQPAADAAATVADGGRMKIVDNTDLNALEAKMGSNEQPTLTGSNGQVLPNLTHPDVNQFLSHHAANFKPGEAAYQPRTGEGVHKEAQGILNDPDKLNKVLAFRTGSTPLTAGEIEAAKYLVDKAQDTVLHMAEQYAQSGDDADLAKAIEAEYNFMMIESIREGSSSVTAADLSQANLMKNFLGGKTLSEFLKGETDEVKKGMIKALNEEVIKQGGGKVNAADRMQKMAEISKLDNEQAKLAVKKAAFQAQGSWKKFGDSLTFTAINFMLSSPKTFFKVFISQAATTGMSISEKLLASALPEYLGGSSQETLQDGMNFAKGQIDAYMEHIRGVGRALDMKGLPEAEKIAQYRVKFNSFNPISSDTLGVQNKVLAKMVDTAGYGISIPTKLVGFHDNFFGQAVYRGKLNELAEGAAGALTGDARTGAIQQFLQNPPAAAHQAGVKAAQEYTMMAPFADNAMGQFGQGLQGLMNDKVPFGNVISPFMKVGFNIADFTYQRSPFKALALLSPSVRQGLQGNSIERAMTISKLAHGAGMLGAATYMAAQGITTGEAPANFELAKATEESHQGWQPDSIRVGNSYVSMRFMQPFVNFMRMGSLLSDAFNYTTKDEYQQLVTMAAGAVVETMTPEMLVEHNTQIMEAANGVLNPSAMGHATANFAVNTAAEILTPAIAKDIRNVTDQYQGNVNPGAGHGGLGYAYEKFKSVLANRMPEFSKDNPINRNIFDEPLLVPSYWPKDDFGTWYERATSMVSPFAVSTGKSSPEVEALHFLGKYFEEHKPLNADLNPLQVSMPSWTFSMNKGTIHIPLTPPEYSRLVAYTAGHDPDTRQPIEGMKDLRTIVQEQVLPFYDRLKQGSITPLEYNSVVGHLNKLFVDVKTEGKARMAQDPMFNKKVQDALQTAGTKQVNVFD